MIKLIRVNNVCVRFDTLTGEGLKQLYELLQPKIEGIVFKTYIEGYDKEDLRQEVKVIIWKATKAYRPGKGKYLTWIIGCIDNRVKSLISNSKGMKFVQLNTNNEAYHLNNIPETQTALTTDNILKSGKYQLSKDQSKVLLMYLNGVSITAIKSKHYANTCYETARQRIRDILKIAGNTIV